MSLIKNQDHQNYTTNQMISRKVNSFDDHDALEQCHWDGDSR